MLPSASGGYNLYNKKNNAVLLEYLNNYRTSLGLPQVTYDYGLEEAARLQVLDNYIKKKFKNRGDDVNKLHQNSRFPLIRDRVKAVGVPTAGESCAEICYAKAGMKNQPLAAAIKPYKSLEQLIFTRYRNSAGHRHIITTAKFTRVGIHTIYDGKYVYNAVVFMTGKPLLANKN
ncbi:hypothetical protein AAE02nite_11250 [Adhaeribacter aerolatus]|uniref:SCP domain-containing protein n=1 Tax=Adhaeribacter aerolatus TaxID=670289 RepID=A0A512AUS8_9BACT|nr:hypothetical protein AAE02nite_11250 [Adhaeribacter aerolatus]